MTQIIKIINDRIKSLQEELTIPCMGDDYYNELQARIIELDDLLTELLNQNLEKPTKWVKVSDGLPDINVDGSKVLIYRVMNQSQESMSMSIHDTYAVKFCDPNETWWTQLPNKPIKKI